MSMPKCGNLRFPSNVQYEPREPSSPQRDSRAFTTNHPSPSVTRPVLLLRSGASGMPVESDREKPRLCSIDRQDPLPHARPGLSLGREQFPMPLGDDLKGAINHLDGGLIVNRVRRN